MIKILHIINSLGCGGIQKQMLELVKNLPSEQFESKILSYDDSEFFELPDNLFVEKIARTRLFPFKAPLRTATLINSWHPDILHVWNIFTLPVLYAAWPFIRNKPVMLNGTLREAPLKIPSAKKLISHTFKFHRYIAANSEASLRSFGELPTGKGRFVVYNGIDASKVINTSKSEARKQLGLSNDKILCGMIASMSVLKDHRTFINTAEICLKKSDKIIFYLIGDGPLRHELEEIVRGKKLDNKIIFTGFRKDIPLFLRALDINVLLSPLQHSEGFPNAVLEAMANGIPSIVTDSGGSAEIIKDGLNGFKIPSNDAEKAAEKILLLSSDETLRNKMSEKTKAYADNFSSSAMLKKYMEIYRKIQAKS